MARPDFNLLVTLDVLLTEGSVARAARRLRLSPSAMSRTLARLRETTGDPLLVRAGRALVPTPRALELRERVSRLVQDGEAILRPAEQLDLKQLVRTFTMRSSEGFVENFGPYLIARVGEQAPGVRLRFIQKPDKDSGPLRNGTVDLETGVVEQGTAPELCVQALFRDRYIGVVRKGHTLTKGKITAARYASGRHIYVSREGYDRGPIDEALQPFGLERQIVTIVGGFATALALARGSDLRIDVGYQAARPLIDVSGQRQNVKDARGLAAGIVLPGQILGVRFAFGATLFLPDQYVTRVHVLSYDAPRLQLYDNRTQRFFLGANLSIRLYRGLYIGGGLAFLSRSAGTVELRGQIALSDPESSTLQSAVAVDLLAIRYPQFGILWEATSHLTLALVYRHSFRLDLSQGFTINADVGDPGQTPVVKDAKLAEISNSVDLFQPWQLVAAAAARFGRVLISFDLTFARWSEQPPPASNFRLDLDIGQLGDLVKLPAARAYPDSGFRDLLIPAVGVEWRAIESAARDRLALDVRGGYRYEASPVPEQLSESSFGDADKHIISGGLGLELRKLGRVLPRPLSIDGFAAVTVLPERIFRKLDPRSAVGDFTVQGLVWQAGGQVRWRF